MVSPVLLDYLVAPGVSTMLIESHTSNPDAYKAYKDALPWRVLVFPRRRAQDPKHL